MQPQLRGASIDWGRIRARAAVFARDWEGETSETAEAQSFWNDFFKIFGRTRRGLAWYEYHAKTLGIASSTQKSLPGSGGRVDMLWPGVLAVEHKSAGKDMRAGEEQLRKYIDALPEAVKPRYGLVCDFARFRLIDSQVGGFHDFTLAELPQNAQHFEFFVESRHRQVTLQLQASEKAVQLMGSIYDALSGYGKDIDDLLMRLLFCMFADDTDIFEKGAFLDFLMNHTKENGDDLGSQLISLFDILNTQLSARQKNTPLYLRKFPYINGDLFANPIKVARFNAKIRHALLEACHFDWSQISPDIFGSLFQIVRDAEIRHKSGEHYTSAENILKAIRPLFLDDLRGEFEKAGRNERALRKLHDKIASMRFLDPACGCGNFLIVAYRELRQLEMEIISLLAPGRALDIRTLTRVNVHQFHGIEIDSFPARIAQTAMWLTDHQMNRETSAMLGEHYVRFPLEVSPGIVTGNALTMDWRNIVKPEELSYIFGNPPFVDRKNRSQSQRSEMKGVFGDANGIGNLDYVSAWFVKAAKYIRGTGIRCAFVATDSITQSMQAAVLWPALYAEGVKIDFAHLPFKWHNEAPDNAQVHVVVVGFGIGDKNGKQIFEHDDGQDEPQAKKAANINAYLMDCFDVLVKPCHAKPISCSVPAMMSGSNPIDNGHLLLSPEEKREMVRQAPQAAQFIRPVMGGEEFLSGAKRWCLWLTNGGAKPSVFRKIAPIRERVQKNKKFREDSDREATRELAKIPHLFGEDRQPDSDYLVVPQTSSGSRHYIPMGFVSKKTVALIKCQIVPKANLFHFGVLSSSMHMEWVRVVGGRLGGGYSYTATLVYNTFPWPEDVSHSQKERIKKCARAILSVRKKYAHTNLGDLYSAMPADLSKAHKALDAAVDRAYRSRKFKEKGQERIEYLFSEYLRLTAPAIPKPKKKRVRAKTQPKKKRTVNG